MTSLPASTSSNSPGHLPVLITDAVAALQPRAGGVYLDGTFGGGGHTRSILEASAPTGRVLAIDADPAAVLRTARLQAEEGIGDRLIPVQANFAALADIAREHGLAPVDGVLLDLGVSSFQLDQAERGFAFSHDGPLDMRFDPERGAPASVLVNDLPERELADLIWKLGEEPGSRRIARAIACARKGGPIETTAHLADIVQRALGGRQGRQTHPATRTFQALRMATNDELGSLTQALNGAIDILAPGGRLVVIAFHSLEDRLVKQFIEREQAACVCPPQLPVCVCQQQPRLRKITKRAVRASAEEVAVNPRARSAVMRVAERLDDAAWERQKPANGGPISPTPIRIPGQNGVKA